MPEASHRIVAALGLRRDKIADRLSRAIGPITVKSCMPASCACQTSRSRTVMVGGRRSVCQQELSRRANSLSSVRIRTLAVFKELRSGIRLSSRIAFGRRLQPLRFVNCGYQPLGADAEVYCGFGVFGLLGHVHTLEQAGDFNAGHGQGAIENGGVAGLLCRLGRCS